MKYVAFIRGVGPENPNMHGDKLTQFFEELGFSNVQTVISSVINPEIKRTPQIMRQLEKEYGKEITMRIWKTIGKIITHINKF